MVGVTACFRTYFTSLPATRRGFLTVVLVAVSALPGMTAVAGERIWVPIRWCGVAGAPSVENPAAIGEASSDTMLWRRHERPTDRFYQDAVNMTFRAASTHAIRNGPMSFPIILDPLGSGGDLVNGAENSDAIWLCRHAWTMGDTLYFDSNGNNSIDPGTDTLLSQVGPTVGDSQPGHGGGALHPMPAETKFVDADTNGAFDIGERIYRDENNDGTVDGGDTLLSETLGTVVGEIDPGDTGSPLVALPPQVKYLDLIREPADTYNVGYPSVEGITAISANDVEYTSIDFPVHGVSVGMQAANMDDPAQYLPPGPDYLIFETQLVGHEFGHALTLNHGDGHDDDGDGYLDNGDDPAAAIPGAGVGTLCDANNVMQYCWRDDGTSGNPNLTYIGPGTADYPSFTPEQAQAMRAYTVANIDDHIIDPVPRPLAATRVDLIGEVQEALAFIDITDFALRVDNARANTVFSLNTRRPFPKELEGITDYHFLLDVDSDAATGGAPATIAGWEIPTKFEGGEYAASVRFDGPEIAGVRLYEYDTQAGAFEAVDDDRVRAVRVRIDSIPDFPFGNRGHDPDSPPPVVPEDFPIAERIDVIVPTDLVKVPEDAVFRVEYVANRPDKDSVDRARSPGLNFRPPVYPECKTDPGEVRRGGTTMVMASGLIPERDQHLLLGDIELTHGMSDAAGNATFTMDIPEDARLGQRLVTVGALAVSADCSVTITDGKPGGLPPGDDCCRQISFQLWIIIAVLMLLVLVCWWRRK